LTLLCLFVFLIIHNTVFLVFVDERQIIVNYSL